MPESTEGGMKGSKRYRSDMLNGGGQRETNGRLGFGWTIYFSRMVKARLSVQST